MNNKIEEILENFNFEKVKKVMDFLEWTWITSKTETQIPNTYELMRNAERLLKDAYQDSLKNKRESNRATGGFRASSFWDEEREEVDLFLSFEIGSWDTFQ